MGSKDKFAVLVQSTDSYEDAWLPFFKLFKTYWPEYDGKIYLATEEKSFSYYDLNIIPTKLAKNYNGEPLTWSACLLANLSLIKEDYVLFILEDLFFDKPVRHDKLMDLFERMCNENISVLYLTDQSCPGPFLQTEGEIIEISQKADYRISCLIAFWKKTKLIEYLIKWENPWQFEHYGTLRSHLIKDKFYSVNPRIFKRENDTPIISHVFPTGITRGKWNENVPELFEKNGIKIDYSKRGFYNNQGRRSLVNKIVNRLYYKNLKVVILFQLMRVYMIILNKITPNPSKYYFWNKPKC